MTWNNYPENHLEILDELPKWTYRIIGYEHAPTTGTPHLQMYYEFANRVRFTTLRKFNWLSNIESRNGTAIQASGYCKDTEKEGPTERWVEEGELSVPEPGKRTDIKNCTDLISAGGSVSQLAQQFPIEYVKYHRGFTNLRYTLDCLIPKRVPHVTVYWGDTGTGKSRIIYDAYSDPNDVYFTSNNKWYQGWNGLSDIVFEEYAGGITLNNFLRLLDRYPVQVETKGGMLNFNPEKIYITSHFHPSQWYPEQADRYPELERRIHVCKHFSFGHSNDPSVSVTKVAGNTIPPPTHKKIRFDEVEPDFGNLGQPRITNELAKVARQREMFFPKR